MKVQPYLFFNGRCEEALDFYCRVLGAEVTSLLRFGDLQNAGPGTSAEDCPDIPPGSEQKVMHCAFRVGETEVMASDGECQGSATFQGVSLSLLVPTTDEADRLFTALGDGGQVQMPIGPTFFSPGFGIVADRFGVSWMVVAEGAPVPQ